MRRRANFTSIMALISLSRAFWATFNFVVEIGLFLGLNERNQIIVSDITLIKGPNRENFQSQLLFQNTMLLIMFYARGKFFVPSRIQNFFWAKFQTNYSI